MLNASGFAAAGRDSCAVQFQESLSWISSASVESLSRFERMAGEKFLRRQAPSAFALQFKNPQRVFAATDSNAGFVSRQNLPRSLGWGRLGEATGGSSASQRTARPVLRSSTAEGGRAVPTVNGLTGLFNDFSFPNFDQLRLGWHGASL